MGRQKSIKGHKLKGKVWKVEKVRKIGKVGKVLSIVKHNSVFVFVLRDWIELPISRFHKVQ